MIDPDGLTGAGCRCESEMVDSPTGEIRAVPVVGEFDLAGEPIVDAELVDAVARASRHLVVDLGGLVFCSVRGLRLPCDTGAAAAAARPSRSVV